MWRGREVVVAVVCLAVGSVGQLVQFLVTPVSEEGSAADNLVRVAASPSRMQAAAWLDVSILFFLPAVAVVGYFAGARATRLGWTATVITVATTIPGIAYVISPDILYLLANKHEVTAKAIDGYNGNSVVVTATVVFLAGHVIGLILMGVAIWRVGMLPRWVGVCLAVYPLLEIAGTAVGVKAVAAVGYLLLTAAFGACAMALVRATPAVVADPVGVPVAS